jgi:hypothetical protein
MGSNWSIVGNILNDVFGCMLVLALRIRTTSHKVKETNNWNIKLLIMRISAVSISEFAFADRIEYAWILSQFVTIFASVS